MLILLALASGTMLLVPKLQGSSQGISPSEAVHSINREKAVVIDVCESAEFATEHVAGARSIPLGELQERLPSAVKNKATPLIMVCASGPRSNRAVGIARKLGYENARSLSGGLKSWRQADLPIEHA